MDYTYNQLSKFQFKAPCTVILSGPTGSGKSELMFKIIKDRDLLFTQTTSNVIYCYNIWQKGFQQVVKNDSKDEIVFHHGLPEIKTLKNDGKHKILIIDDLMNCMDKKLSDLFCVQSHHLNISVFFINQNLFIKNTFARNITLNALYLIIFKIRRDLISLRRLGSQLFPGQSDLFLKVYNECTKERYSYMLIDCHPDSVFRVTLRSKILPKEIEYIYYPKE